MGQLGRLADREVSDTRDVAYPEALQDLLDTFAAFDDMSERAQVLISFSDGFKEVPKDVATRPFPKDHLVPACESEAYVWAVLRPDGTMDLYFAVENPSGISARALASMLTKTLSGLTPREIATVSPEIVERLFRQNISMGKGMGLMSMVGAVRALALRAQGIEPKPADTVACPE
jgi:cysteine desulfuration protein SufE